MSVTTEFRHVEQVASVARDIKDSSAGPSEPIASSWRRCVNDFGMDPANQFKPTVIESGEIKRRQEQVGELLEIGRFECQNLYEQTTASGYAIVLADTDGVVLHYTGQPQLANSFRDSGLREGGVWREDMAGTNAMGICLVSGEPIIVHRDEHFYNCHTSLTCSAAPIRDPQGQLMAVLDQTSVRSRDTKQTQWHTMALINMSAKLIENRYFQHQHRDDMVLRFHSRPEFVGVLTEAMLAIDDSGKICAANSNAVEQLGYGTCELLLGNQLSEVFHMSHSMLSERAAYQPHTVWPVRDTRNGRRYYCMLNVQQKIIAHAEPLRREHKPLRVPACSPTLGRLDLHELAGSDSHMSYNVRCVERVANKKVSILLTGETGTGKEVFARAIHSFSERSANEFVALNCAAIPESLIESELFGYKHGAFTGARREGMRGSVLQSNGGTLFLDEIGDMPSNLQTRLLRVLEEKEVLPLGSEVPIAVDLNVVCASHQDLRKQVEEGQFRDDLYFRLNGITLALPPLRDRSDLEDLIRSSLVLENDTGKDVVVEGAAFQCLLNYSWPGNIRELRNVLRTALALSDEGIIRLADLPKEIACPEDRKELPAASPLLTPLAIEEVSRSDFDHTPLESAEREVLIGELERNHWNVTTTARRLKMSRSTLYRKVKKYGIPFSH